MLIRFAHAVPLLMLFVMPSIASAQTPPPATGKADSLRNGIVAGAIVGAIGGAFAGLALAQDCLECPGFNVPLTLAAVGAGVGIGIGAGVDALRARQTPTRAAGVTPLLTPRVRGAMIWIRF